MPKNWSSRKAELRRLYIDEGKKLLDIQRILESQGFKASVRSYRKRFEEWEFRKYKLKDARHRTTKTPAKVSLSRLPTSERQLHHFTVGSNDLEPTRENELRRALSLPPSCHNTATLSSSLVVDNVSIHDEFFCNFDDATMIFLGEFRVPKRPASPSELILYLPHSSGLQIYGLIATWKDEGEWMNHLRSMLNDPGNRSMILNPPQNIRIEQDFVAVNYFDAITRCISSFRCQIDVKRLILLAIERQDAYMPQSPPWVIDWWRASKVCEWSVALYLLRHNQLGSNIREFFTTTGQFMIGKRLLYHHYDILVNDIECSHSNCAWMRVERTQDLMKEYVAIIQDITGIESGEEKLDSKLFEFALEVLSDAEETISHQAETLRLQIKNTHLRKNKCCQVIAKCTNVNAKEVENNVDQLSTPEINLTSPVHHTAVLPTSNAGKCHEVATSPVEAELMIPTLSLTKYPPDFLDSWSNLFDIWERDRIFVTLLKEWTLWRSSTIGTMNFYNKIRNISRRLQSFEALDFKALVHWTSGNLEITDKITFLRNLVQAYLHWGDHSPVFKVGFQAMDVAHWNTVKKLVLAEQEFLPRIVSPWPALEYPEVMLRLFGEACLESLLPLEVSTENYIYSKPQPQSASTSVFNSTLGRTIIHDFQAWDIDIGYSL